MATQITSKMTSASIAFRLYVAIVVGKAFAIDCMADKVPLPAVPQGVLRQPKRVLCNREHDGPRGRGR